jgi:cytochrome c-type biogenesis protein CcmH
VKRLAVAVVVALLCCDSSALAAGCPRTSVADLENEVMCPVCGTSLAVAREAPLARRERAFIARRVRQCRSKREIETALVAQFGPGVLALPPDRGIDAGAYLAPAGGGALAVAGTALVLVVWRRRGRRRPAPAGPLATPSSADQRRLDAELDRLR